MPPCRLTAGANSSLLFARFQSLDNIGGIGDCRRHSGWMR
jgi:hypothetical protein